MKNIGIADIFVFLVVHYKTIFISNPTFLELFFALNILSNSSKEFYFREEVFPLPADSQEMSEYLYFVAIFIRGHCLLS
jgi:hypothetical protein